MRDERFWPDLYFGKPGSLTTLPYPRGGMDTPYDRQTYDFVTGSGLHRVSKLAEGSREYTLNWNALSLDTYAKIEAYDRGTNGVGPWALLDPSRVNLLTANQSSATGSRNTTAGFSVATANMGSLSSNSVRTNIFRAAGSRSLKWTFDVNPINTFPVLELSSVWSGWYGIPVTTLKTYIFSFWIKESAGSTYAAKIKWYDSAGVVVGTEATSGDFPISAGVWSQFTCGATPPGGAAFASPRIVATGSSLAVGNITYIDQLQFEISTAATAWVPGTGLYPVETLGLSEIVPFSAAWRRGSVLSLREVVG